jgi:ABC-2 type transport system permease protein
MWCRKQTMNTSKKINKFWQIVWHEYSRHVFRRRFLLALFSVPILLVVMTVLIIVIIRTNTKPTPVGYIDHSGILSNPISQPAAKWPERTLQMVPYTDETSARADLQAGNIQVYYVIPQDYLNTGQAQVTYEKELNGTVAQQFNDFLKINLFSDQPADIAKRIIDGSDIVVQSTDQSQVSMQDRIINLILPIIAGILFIVAMTTSSGYLLQAVVEEKENRTMEIMVTSVSPGQLMSGKVVGDIAVSLTQLLVWGGFLVLALLFGKSYFTFLSGFRFSGETIGIIIAVMIPAFIMISGLMATVGATVTEASEGQQILGLFTIPIWIPYFLISAFINSPNSPLAVALSFFPLTAPMTIIMRIGLSTIPTWQIFVSVIILILSAAGSLWLAGRAFRLGMLRYGQRLRLKEIFRQQRVKL